MTVPLWLTGETPIAHRGLYSEKLPENTLGAFRLAIENKLPVEFDLQLTSDNKLIVFHDRNLLRLTGQHMTVTTNKLCNIQKHPILNSGGESIPSFEEFLGLIRGQIPLVIELKPAKIRHRERAWAIREALKNYDGQFVIQSFDPRIVRWLKNNSDFTVGLIVGRYRDPTASRELRARFEKLWLADYLDPSKMIKPDFIAHDLKTLSPAISELIREKKNLPLITWTVNSEDKIRQARALADNYIFESMTVDQIFAQPK